MKILIVEDENTVAQRLERLTREILGNKLDAILVKHTLDDADEYLASQPVDLLFLDLNLAGRDGFQLLQQVVAKSFHTIVVSAYAERAIEAFEYGVLDFVAKPFTKSRLEKALSRFHSPETQQQTKYLAIKRKGLLETVDLSSVYYFQGANIYSEVVLDSKETLLHDKPLNRLEQLLPAHFLRIHKSFIVNESAVSGYVQRGNNGELLLNNGLSVPVSRSKTADIKAKFI